MELIILTLATYGLSSLLTAYDGPQGVFKRLRTKYPNSALMCLVCTTTWLIIPFFILYLLDLTLWLTPLAVIGAIILIESVVD